MNKMKQAGNVQQLITELLSLVEISTVFVLRMDFALMPDMKIPQPYNLNLGHAPVNLTIRDNEILVVVGFAIDGIANDQPLFSGHFDYQIVFKHDNPSRIKEILEIDEVRSFFCGAQADKIVWSYLRNAVHQILLDAGLPSVVIPLYR
ncbi:MAG: hypothetical protein CVU48_06640 [Candidatus Cloacimonetes bacterium HGW-Cloacimonetes-1]|jgi:hypothetical protein|nr:MAG: hypothetical protein CVU48_06640 [Candidatus Cloacimonetes bacterium HGW-Cloacimonetes-1]